MSYEDTVDLINEVQNLLYTLELSLEINDEIISSDLIRIIRHSLPDNLMLVDLLVNYIVKNIHN
ncbi:MAG: hypothetical protein KHY88_00175 [Erysipelotrichaceae bacterium]|nr:hypothetical protein [Erysipelotrichaceae bacterium]